MPFPLLLVSLRECVLALMNDGILIGKHPLPARQLVKHLGAWVFRGEKRPLHIMLAENLDQGFLILERCLELFRYVSDEKLIGTAIDEGGNVIEDEWAAEIIVIEHMPAQSMCLGISNRSAWRDLLGRRCVQDK